MRVVVATVAHRGDDARIVHRQARTLLEAGHSVVLISPEPGEESRRFDPDGLERIRVPRATGRHRLGSWWSFWLIVGKVTRGADLLLVHDPELVPLSAYRRLNGVRKMWDVHEDYLAYAPNVSWLSGSSRSLLRLGVKLVYRVGRNRFGILVAEESYRKDFSSAPVVRNTTVVSDEVAGLTNPDQVVYVGRISRDRGCSEMLEIGRRLANEMGVSLVLVGPCDVDCEEEVRGAAACGWVDWRGVLPNPKARSVIRGSLVGLSLLHDVANYRHSLPSKMFDYWSEGLPVIATPLPASIDLISASHGGALLSAFEGSAVVDEVVQSIVSMREDLPERSRLGESGWKYARDWANWTRDGAEFERLIRMAPSPQGRRRSV